MQSPTMLYIAAIHIPSKIYTQSHILRLTIIYSFEEKRDLVFDLNSDAKQPLEWMKIFGLGKDRGLKGIQGIRRF